MHHQATSRAEMPSCGLSIRSTRQCWLIRTYEVDFLESSFFFRDHNWTVGHDLRGIGRRAIPSVVPIGQHPCWRGCEGAADCLQLEVGSACWSL